MEIDLGDIASLIKVGRERDRRDNIVEYGNAVVPVEKNNLLRISMHRPKEDKVEKALKIPSPPILEERKEQLVTNSSPIKGLLIEEALDSQSSQYSRQGEWGINLHDDDDDDDDEEIFPVVYNEEVKQEMKQEVKEVNIMNRKPRYKYEIFKIRNRRESRELRMSINRSENKAVHIKLIQYNEESMKRIKQFICESKHLVCLKISLRSHFHIEEFNRVFNEMLCEIKECGRLEELRVEGICNEGGVVIEGEALNAIFRLKGLRVLKVKNMSLEWEIEELLQALRDGGRMLHTLFLVNVYRGEVDTAYMQGIHSPPQIMSKAIVEERVLNRLERVRVKWDTIYSDYWDTQLLLLAAGKLSTLDLHHLNNNNNNNNNNNIGDVGELVCKDERLNRVKVWGGGELRGVLQALQALQSHIGINRLDVESESRWEVWEQINHLLRENPHIRRLTLRDTEYPSPLFYAHLLSLRLYATKFLTISHLNQFLSDLTKLPYLRYLRIKQFFLQDTTITIKNNEYSRRLSELFFENLGGMKKVESVVVTENRGNERRWVISLDHLITFLEGKPKALKILKLSGCVVLYEMNALCNHFDPHPIYSSPPLTQNTSGEEEGEGEEEESMSVGVGVSVSNNSNNRDNRDNRDINSNTNNRHNTNTNKRHEAYIDSEESVGDIKLKIERREGELVIGEIRVDEDYTTLGLNLGRILRITRKLHISGAHSPYKIPKKLLIANEIFLKLRRSLTTPPILHSLPFNSLKLSLDFNIPFLFQLLSLISALPKCTQLKTLLLKNTKFTKDCNWIFEIMDVLTTLNISKGDNPRYSVIYNRLPHAKSLILNSGAGNKLLDRVTYVWKPNTLISLADIRIAKNDYNEQLKEANPDILIYQSNRMLK